MGSIRDIEVKVVPPPALNRLTIRLVSPKYPGIATQTLAAGSTSFRVLEGTRIDLAAQANKALAAAELYLGDQPGPAASRSTPPDRLSDEFPGQGERGVLVRLEGFRGIPQPRLGPLRPSARSRTRRRVVIAEPRTDHDVPADAHGPRPGRARRRLRPPLARLLYKVSAGSEPHDAVAIPVLSAPGEEPRLAQPAFVKHQEIAYEWNLAPLKLAIGSIITFHADARDFDSIKGPNVGKSRELRLRIVSKEDAARQVDDGRRELREEIARILAMQRQAITPVEDATRTLSRTDRLPRAQRDDLNNAGLIQAQVGSRMSNRDEGLEQKLRRWTIFATSRSPIRKHSSKCGTCSSGSTCSAIATSARPNRASLGPAKASSRLPSLRRARPLPRTKRRSQPPTSRKAAKTSRLPSRRAKRARARPVRSRHPPGDRKDQAGTADRPQDAKPGEQPAQAGPKPQPQQSGSPQDIARRSLAEAKTNQKAIADELQKMLEGLGEFETYRGVVKDAQALLKKQEETMKQAAEAAAKPDLMGKSAESLSPEQKAELDNLAARQSDLGKGLQNLLGAWTTSASVSMSPTRWPLPPCVRRRATAVSRAPAPDG